MVVFDQLALLVANPFGGQRTATEGDPLEDLIETFAMHAQPDGAVLTRQQGDLSKRELKSTFAQAEIASC